MAQTTQELHFDVEAYVHVDTTKTFTTALVTVRQGGQEWSGIGTAKRARGDKYDEPTGATLATARAFRSLAEELEAEAAKASG